MIKKIAKKTKGWRTIVINTALTITPILELTEVSDVMPENWLPWYALTVALINMALRAVTTSPIGTSK